MMIRSLLVVIVLWCLGAPLVTAETLILPDLSIRPFFDNNPRVRVEDPQEVIGVINEAKFAGLYRRPTYEISVTPKFRLSRYTEETELDSEDYFIEAIAQKFFERSQFATEFNFEREASISTELNDSGIFNVNLPRTTYSIESSWTFNVTDTLNFSVSGNALDVTFKEDVRSAFVDYQQYGAGPNLTYALSDRTSIFASLYTSIFKTPATNSETQSYSFQFGFEHQFYESLRAAFRIGHNISTIDFLAAQTTLVSLAPFRVQTTFFDESERSSGEIVNVSLTKTFERASFELEWDRSFSPSSQGARQETDSVEGFFRYRVSRFVYADLRGSFRQRKQEGQANTRRLSDLDVLRIDARILYRWTPEIQAEFGFRHLRHERPSIGTEADSQRVFIFLRYTPTQIALRF